MIQVVRLDFEEAKELRRLAAVHNRTNRDRRNPDLVISRESLQADVISALACGAAEKASGDTWLGRENISDLAAFQTVGSAQVRSTVYDTGGLRVRPVPVGRSRRGDPVDLMLVFVIVDESALTFRVFPAFRAGDGQRPEFWRPGERPGDPPWYRVPTAVLLGRPPEPVGKWEKCDCRCGCQGRAWTRVGLDPRCGGCQDRDLRGDEGHSLAE